MTPTDQLPPPPPPPPITLPPPVPPPGPRPVQPGRPARTGWLVAGAVALVLALGWGTYQMIGLVAHEKRTFVERFDAAAVSTIEIRTDNGHVTVIGRDGLSEVVVTSNVTESLRSPRRRADRRADRLVLDADCPRFAGQWCSADYVVETPRDMALDIDSENGSIEIRGIDGDVVAFTDNGRIEVVDASGALELDSDNGRVTAEGLRSSWVKACSDNGRIELEFLAEPDEVVAETSNGRVEVIVPRTDATYRLELDSDNGDVNEEIRTDPTSRRLIRAESDNGSVTVRYPDTR